MTERDFKLLFVAFACEPGRGSEPGVGWGFVDEASRRREVWLITHAHHRHAMDTYLETRHKQHRINVAYVQLNGLKWLWKTHFGMNLYYYFWQFKAAAIGRKLHRDVAFDIVQHVSFTRYWMQSAGPFIGGKFVFGPVGGGDAWPKSFHDELTLRERVREKVWAAVRWVMERDPLLHMTLRRTRYAIGSGHHGAQQLRRLGLKNVDMICAVAPTPELPPVQEGPLEEDVFRFVSIGRLPRWKGVHLGIEAFAKAFGPQSSASHRRVEYLVIGDGDDLTRLEQLADKRGVANRVKFTGDLPYSECISHLLPAGALVHPAMRDSAGLVFEALSLGVPVLCTDVGTPALLVTERCGHIVSVEEGAPAVIQELANTMLQWTANLTDYRALRLGAVQRAAEMSRTRRGDMMDAIYYRVLGRTTTPADAEDSSGAEADEGSFEPAWTALGPAASAQALNKSV